MSHVIKQWIKWYNYIGIWVVQDYTAGGQQLNISRLNYIAIIEIVVIVRNSNEHGIEATSNSI